MKIKIHHLPADPGKHQTRKRIGRGHGSGWGTTAGRGYKGQKARSGHGKGPGFEGGQMSILRRLPKGGFTNPFPVIYSIVNLDQLNIFDEGSEITPQVLFEKRLIRKSAFPVKVLGNGNLTKKLIIKAHKFSKSAQDKITSAGGSAEVIE